MTLPDRPPPALLLLRGGRSSGGSAAAGPGTALQRGREPLGPCSGDGQGTLGDAGAQPGGWQLRLPVQPPLKGLPNPSSAPGTSTQGVLPAAEQALCAALPRIARRPAAPGVCDTHLPGTRPVTRRQKPTFDSAAIRAATARNLNWRVTPRVKTHFTLFASVWLSPGQRFHPPGVRGGRAGGAFGVWKEGSGPAPRGRAGAPENREPGTSPAPQLNFAVGWRRRLAAGSRPRCAGQRWSDCLPSPGQPQLQPGAAAEDLARRVRFVPPTTTLAKQLVTQLGLAGGGCSSSRRSHLESNPSQPPRHRNEIHSQSPLHPLSSRLPSHRRSRQRSPTAPTATPPTMSAPLQAVTKIEREIEAMMQQAEAQLQTFVEKQIQSMAVCCEGCGGRRSDAGFSPPPPSLLRRTRPSSTRRPSPRTKVGRRVGEGRTCLEMGLSHAAAPPHPPTQKTLPS